MLKIYDDKLAEEICARMDEEILALDAHITELLNYGKIPEIVASMQARREAAERVKSNIRRVNDEAHRIDAEAAAELRKETEKLRAFSQKLDDINAMLVSVMKPEAVHLSNDSGVGVGKTDMLGSFRDALIKYEKEEVKGYVSNYLESIGIGEGTSLYDICMRGEQYIPDSAYLIRSSGSNAYGNMIGTGQYELAALYVLRYAYTMSDKTDAKPDIKIILKNNPQIRGKVENSVQPYTIQSTKDFLKTQEGIFETVKYETDENGNKIKFSIGYGYDFTKDSNPEAYERYYKNHERITEEDADSLLNDTLEPYETAVNNFVQQENLILNQNQYDVLVSYYYNNGINVFSEENCDTTGKTGANYERAAGRAALKEYLITENGNYKSERIKELFVNSRGPNLDYTYENRRSEEAALFCESLKEVR